MELLGDPRPAGYILFDDCFSLGFDRCDASSFFRSSLRSPVVEDDVFSNRLLCRLFVFLVTIGCLAIKPIEHRNIKVVTVLCDEAGLNRRFH